MAYFPFDGNAIDMSGNGNVGTIYGGVSFVNGVNGAAAKFDGVNGYIEVPSSASLKPMNHFSVNLWLHVQNFTNQLSPVFIKGGSKVKSEAQRSYALWLQNTAPFLQLTSAGDGSGQIIHYAGIVDTGTWINYTGIIDRENHITSVYINGTLVFRGIDAYSSFNDNDNSLRFGWTQEIHSKYSPFCGKIDEARFYNRNLSDEEIKELYLKGTKNQIMTLNTISIDAFGDNFVSKGSGVQDCNDKLYISQFSDFRGWLGSRKVWISFDISALKNNGQLIDNASLLLTRAAWGNYSTNFIDVDVYGLLDCPEDSWGECNIDWWNAPGNSTSSRGTDEIKTTLLGKLIYINDVAGIGNQHAIYGKELVRFLNSDQNGIITIILAFNHSSPAVWTAYESSESGVPNFSIPKLLVNTLDDNNSCLSISPSNIIPINQSTNISREITLSNISTSVQTCTLQVLNSLDDINVTLNGSQYLNLNPGECYNIPVEINTAFPVPKIYNLLLRAHSGSCEPVYSDIFLKVLPPATPPLPDLFITSSDINLVDYQINGPALLNISVQNNGTAEATNIPLTIYRFNNLITTATIGSIKSGATQTIQVTIPMITPGEHLINVFVDSLQSIKELDKNNNETSKIIIVGGQSLHPGGILVMATLPNTVYTDALFNISGRTMYDINVDGVRYFDFPVKGGALTMTVSNNAGHSWVYNGTHSTISGDFSKILQAPVTTGDYTVTISATDQTLFGSRTISFTVIDRPEVIPPPPQPPLPPRTCGSGTWIWYPGEGIWNGSWGWTWNIFPSVPVPQKDISVYSENIHFSNSNPALGEEMTIFTEFKYWASSTTLDAANVPINIYVIRPGSEKIKVGSTIINKLSISAPENGSRFVYVDWKNDLDGVYIVEAEVDPSYAESNMKNNAATRAIIVGKYVINHGILSGQVTGHEGGMKDIGIELYDDYGMLRYTTTASNGFYLIDTLQAGIYTVKCVIPVGYASDTVSKSVEIIDQQVTTADFSLFIPEAPPVPNIDPLPDLSGECSVNATVVPTAIDRFGNTINGTTDDPISYTEQGEYTINWHFTDVSGNTTTQTQSVFIKDNYPPEVETLPVLISDCSVIISSPPTAEDNCGGIITGTATSSLPLIFDQQGTFIVNWTFSDGHGNSSKLTQTIVVADNLAPVPDILDLPDISGTGSVSVTVIPTATDNCIGSVNGATTDPLTYNQPGTYTITWSYSDGHGNNSSQQQKIIVIPDVPIESCVSNLAARAKQNKIQLTWAHNGSSIYQIYRSEESATSGFSEIATTSSTYSTYLDEGLTAGKTYWYKVTSDGSCSNSKVVSAIPQYRTVRINNRQ